MNPAAKPFTATLERLHMSLGTAIVARVPLSVEHRWVERRGLRVRGEIEGFAFRTALFGLGLGEGHFILVNKKMQAAARATVGSRVTICLEPDLEERTTTVSPELAKALKGDRRLRPWFDKLGPGMRAYIAKWAADAKSDAARVRRAEQVAEWLLETLEGELETPPILERAFRRQPRARVGWEAMTKAQRRGHLLGIFHLRGVDARGRRVEKMLEEAVGRAEKITERLD